MKRISILLYLTVISLNIFAQNKSEIHSEIIIKLASNYPIQDFLSNINAEERSQSFSIKQSIDAEMGYYLLHNPFENLAKEEVFAKIFKQKGIINASFNHIAKQRSTTPNDSLFSKQWDITKIMCPEVWDFTTGGKTACGDEIVVAVCEPTAGFQITHPDVAPNLWKNPAEIAGDNIDNDNNGYIDDINGIDVKSASGKIAADLGLHGTSVLGIIGAKGNNTKGVSGVNWNVKMMLLSSMSTEAEAIAGYGYIAKMRKLYNETDGKKGAFIVITNYSGGIDKVFEADTPLWCDMYNQLGEAGVLSAGAGPNQNTNVDTEGDIPTTCSSPYLIAVTNSNRNDSKVDNAGYGVLNIDLAAPGGTTTSSGQLPQASFTTKVSNQYNDFTGTSAATPHVAGAVALLYSIPDSTLCKNAKKLPKETALFMKNIILENVDKATAFSNKTVSGGRLNVFKSYNALKSSLTPIQVGELEINPNPVRDQLILKINSLSSAKQTFYIYNMEGQLMQKFDFTPVPLTTTVQKIDVSNLTSGIYSLTSIDSNGKLVSQKFVKQ